MNDSGNQGRLSYLDSARGLAAISVITWHFLLAVYGLSIAGFHFSTPLRFFWYGEANVLFFFIHSGFILSYSFTRRKWALTVRSFARYLIERIFRIYPLFVVILLLSLIAVNNSGPYLDRSPDGWINRFWYTDFTITGFLKEAILVVRYPESANLRLIPQDWTLTVELLAGAAIPLLAISGKKNLLYFILLMAILKITNLLTTYIFEFGLGVLLFLWWQPITNIWKRMKSVTKITIAIAAVLLYTGFFVFPSIYTNDIVLLRSPAIDRFIVDMGCVLFFVMLLASAKLQQILSASPLVYIGKICYSIYLVHKLILLVFWRSFEAYFTQLQEQTAAHIILVFMAYLITVIFVSVFTYRFIEKPAIKFGKKIAAFVMRRQLVTT